MADIYEFLISLDLRPDLTDEDIAELRWHVGQGEAPADEDQLAREHIGVIKGDDGALLDTDPLPLLNQDGPAWKVGGMLSSNLERTTTGWHLGARQEVHPEDFETFERLLAWLYRHMDAQAVAADGSAVLGRLRWYEDAEFLPLMIRDHQIAWP